MIVVTGGAGFIGSALVWALNQRGEDRILVVDQLGSGEKWRNLNGLDFLDYWPKARFIEAVRTDALGADVATVFHMGACSSTTERDVDYLAENNTRYSVDLARWCRSRGVRLVYASSAATYGDGRHGFSDDHATTSRLQPLNPYGWSKQRVDLVLLRDGTLDHVAGVKFFNVYGPNEYHKGDMASVVFKAAAQVRDTGVIRLFRSYRDAFPDGGQLRDFVYVKDAVEAVLWLGERPAVNGLFNVGSGVARTWNDLARAVFAALGREPAIDYIEMPETIRPNYQYETQASLAKLRRVGCDVRFRSLEEGVAEYVGVYLRAGPKYLSDLSATVLAGVRGNVTTAPGKGV